MNKLKLAIICLVLASPAIAQNTVQINAFNKENSTGYVGRSQVNNSGDLVSIAATENRGYMSFNLSTIPAGSVIQSAQLGYFVVPTGSVNITNSPGRVTKLEVNTTQLPVTFEQVSSGTIFGDLNFDGSPGEKLVNINAAGVSELNKKLGTVISVGIVPPANGGKYDRVAGYNSTSTTSPAPFLRVTYIAGTPSKPSPAFSSNKRKVVLDVDSSVSFFDNSGGAPNQWLWDFGDGITSTLQNPIHNYSQVGTYTVKLKVKNSAGEDSINKTDYITVELSPKMPEAAFRSNLVEQEITFDPGIQFTDESTNDPVAWKWYFGNGDSSEIQNPFYSYTEPGRYTVQLIASNQAGADTIVKKYLINAFDQFEGAIANFEIDSVDLLVNFTDLSVNKPTSWSWDFDNANPGTLTSTEQNPSFTYPAPGTYEVCLTVQNNNNNQPSTICKTVVAKPIQAPEANFENIVKENLMVDFIDISQNFPREWYWDFGDSIGISFDQNPTYQYAQPGIYTVRLIVINPIGADTVEKQVDVQLVGIKSFTKSQLLKVYPNPTQQLVSVTHQQPIQNIRIYDIMGKLTKTIVVNSLQSTIDMSAYTNGIYFIEAQGYNFIERIQLLKN